MTSPSKLIIKGRAYHVNAGTVKVLVAHCATLLEAIDFHTLEAIANEIQSFKHSARADSLRVVASKQRAAVASVENPPGWASTE